MKAIKETKTINTQTGEINKDTKYTDLLFDYERGFIFWSTKNHIRTFLELPIPAEFSLLDKGRITELRQYIIKDSQKIGYKSNGVIKPFTVKKISRIIQTSERQSKVFLKKCKKHKIIKELKIDEKTWFLFNPLYGMRAKRLTVDAYIAFQDELRPHLPYWVINKFLEQAKEITTRPVVIE
jgi:hypothetical protein